MNRLYNIGPVGAIGVLTVLFILGSGHLTVGCREHPPQPTATARGFPGYVLAESQDKTPDRVHKAFLDCLESAPGYAQNRTAWCEGYARSLYGLPRERCRADIDAAVEKERAACDARRWKCRAWVGPGGGPVCQVLQWDEGCPEREGDSPSICYD